MKQIHHHHVVRARAGTYKGARIGLMHRCFLFIEREKAARGLQRCRINFHDFGIDPARRQTRRRHARAQAQRQRMTRIGTVGYRQRFQRVGVKRARAAAGLNAVLGQSILKIHTLVVAVGIGLLPENFYRAEQRAERSFDAPRTAVIADRAGAPGVGVGLPQQEHGRSQGQPRGARDQRAALEGFRGKCRHGKAQRRQHCSHNQHRIVVAYVGNQTKCGNQHACYRANGADKKHVAGAAIAVAAA